jgi:ribosomal protein L40E
MISPADYQFTPYSWAILGLLVAALVISAFRMARMAEQFGHNRYLWFVISLFLTAIPATLYFWREQARRIRADEQLASFARRRRRRDQTRNPSEDEDDTEHSRADLRRCPHCGAVVPAEADRCENCSMKQDREHYA